MAIITASRTHIEEFLVLEGLGHGVLAVVQGILPGMEQEGQPQLPRSVTLQRLTDGDEVLQGLGHLTAVYVEVARVEEVLDPVAVAIGRLRSLEREYREFK